MRAWLLGLLVASSMIGSHALAAGGQWHICDSPSRVTCIVDGDTFWAEGVKYRIRGIDAPEAGDGAHCLRERERADAATRRLRDLMSAGPPRLIFAGQDRYGRELVDVEVNEADVGAAMIAEGFAREFKRGQKRDGQLWCGL